MKNFLKDNLWKGLGVLAVAALLGLFLKAQVTPVAPVVVITGNGQAQVVESESPKGFLGLSSDTATRFTDVIVENDFQVDGATALTGALTQSGALTVAGESNLDTLVFGGDVLSLTPAVSTTLTAAQVCDSAFVSVGPTGPAINVILPSTTTLIADCIPSSGDAKMFLYENAATAATNTTIVAGGGITLLGNPTSTAAGADVIGQNEWARVILTNTRSGVVTAEIIPFGDAD